MTGTVAVIIVNYGASALVEENVMASLPDEVDARRVVVIVVDNYFNAMERERVRAMCVRRRWHLVALEDNRGFGAGCNAGATTAGSLGATSLILLNPDARLTPGSLLQLQERVEQNQNLVVSPVIRRPDHTMWFDGADLDLRNGSTQATRKRTRHSEAHLRAWISGACLAVSTDLWDRVGGFDEDYFLYWEDIDWSWRAAALGARLEVDSQAEAIHEEGGTQGKAGGRAMSDLYYYYNVRNRLVFARKHLRAGARWRWMATSFSAARQIVLRGGRRQLVHRTGPLTAACRGTWDGLRLTLHESPGHPEAPALSVLQSFPQPRATTNPYIVMLKDALESDQGLAVRTFSWRRALTEFFDVFHVHWPEILLEGRNPLRRVVKRVLFATLLVRLSLRSTAIVRTQHNVEMPSGLGRTDTALLRLFERQTALLICLNDQTQATQPKQVILHGHYRDWYSRFDKQAAIPGRLGYFGLIRRYKAVDVLLRTFIQLPGKRASLRIGGRPSSAAIGHELCAAAGGDPRVELDLRFLEDAELVELATQSQLVVLPYKDMHNSGSVLAALSLDRPVLVPNNAVNRALAEEVGDGWVMAYDDLRPEVLADALERAAALEGSPDLSLRDWDRVAAQHRHAYRTARTVLLHRTRGTRAARGKL